MTFSLQFAELLISESYHKHLFSIGTESQGKESSTKISTESEVTAVNNLTSVRSENFLNFFL